MNRFWSKVDKCGPTVDPSHGNCWLWRAGRDEDGYGRFCFNGRTQGAHRVSYLISFGPIPDGLVVMHRCDQRLCVRPGHLSLGTNEENTADRVAKGRSAFGERNGSRLYPDRQQQGAQHHKQSHPELIARGESHGRAKLTRVQVDEIRRRHGAGEGQADLAREFGIGKTTIGHLLAGRTWK